MEKEVLARVKKIVKTAKSCGLRVSNGYSGRAMCGSTCLSVSGSYDDLHEFLLSVGKKAVGYTEDSMGKGGLYYWRGLSVPRDVWQELVSA